MEYKHLRDLYNQLLIDYNKLDTEFIKLKHYISVKEKENIETIVSKNQEIASLEKENKILRENAEHNDKVVDKVNWENKMLKKEIEELKISNKSDDLIQVSIYDYINKNHIISIEKEKCLTAYGLTYSYKIKTCKKTYFIDERNKYFKNIEGLLK